MSKRLKNYPDPVEVVKKHGADALRWVVFSGCGNSDHCAVCVCKCRLYLINSPVVRAESLKFQESGVRDVVKDVFLPWFNAYRFLIQSVFRLQQV